VGATVAREGLEFGVLSRELAVGGQQLAIRGLLGDYDGLYLPLFGAYQAGNAACALAAVEAFAGAAPVPAAPGSVTDQAGATDGGHGQVRTVSQDGAQPPAPLDDALVREAFAMMTSPGRLEIVRRSPLVIIDAAHNPAGMAAATAALTEAFAFAELVVILAVSADKDIAGILDQLEPVAGQLVVTGNSSDRSMDPGKLAELAVPVFGPERVTVAIRLDDAIEIAVGLADEAAGGPDAPPGSAAVLITGSVVTVGDARQLLTGTAAGADDA
jgi:dihydrofolate synthase/folylpolyglutamate synthase